MKTAAWSKDNCGPQHRQPARITQELGHKRPQVKTAGRHESQVKTANEPNGVERSSVETDLARVTRKYQSIITKAEIQWCRICDCVTEDDMPDPMFLGHGNQLVYSWKPVTMAGGSNADTNDPIGLMFSWMHLRFSELANWLPLHPWAECH